jgi:creatinine amidohydrolase
VLAFGCSSEHLAFPGTLHVRPETLVALLRDVLASLREHGFARAFLFSAHGGNLGWLELALPELVRASAPLAVSGFTDLDALTAAVHRASRVSGIDAAASGQHAGEFETSIMAALAPAAIRRDALRPGLLHGQPRAQGLFHPNLRAPGSGVVGDPLARPGAEDLGLGRSAGRALPA